MTDERETSVAIIQHQKALIISQQYGKGKIVQRKQGSRRITLPPAKEISSVPAIFLYFVCRRAQDLLAHEVVRYARWLEEGELPILDLGIAEHRREAWQLLRSCSPAHLRNTHLLNDPDQQLQLAYLVEISKNAPVGFLVCMDDSNCFRECKAENNAFGSEYHVREPVCTTMTASLSEFARSLKQWQKKSVLLQLKVKEMRQPGEDQKPELKPDLKLCLCQAQECTASLHDCVSKCIQWEWLQDLQKRHRMGNVIAATLLVGGRNALLPMQYTTHDRLLLQIQGTRRVLIVDPQHSFKGLYSYPVHHPYDSYSMVDWEKPDPDDWQLCHQVRGRFCILQPGDVLFVPACWWVHEQLCSEENVALSFSLGLGFRIRPDPAISLRVSRLVEEILGDLDGPGRIQHWLDLLEREAEDDVIDEWTVDGYLQTEAVWDAREEVEFVLGKGAWRNLFHIMREGRLQPTPWLNKNFREPLYLMDKPRRIPDTRTEEQRQYPELFRHAQ